MFAKRCLLGLWLAQPDEETPGIAENVHLNIGSLWRKTRGIWRYRHDHRA